MLILREGIMHCVAVCAQKGGVGKTTIAQCLAVEGLKEGRRSAIIDMDPQASVVKWSARRAQQGILVPAAIAPGSKPVKSTIAELEKQGAALLIIDTPPLVTPALNAALESADSVVLVTRPNPMDIEALEATWDIVRQFARLRMVAIITQVPPSSQRARALKLAISRLKSVNIPTCPSSLSYTLGYPYAQAEALTVQEREPYSKARAEMAEVWAHLKKINIL